MAAVGDKRKLEAFFGAPAPKLREHTRDTLAALSPEALLETACALADRCRALESAAAAAAAATVQPCAAAPLAAASGPARPGLSPEATKAQAEKVAAVALKQIRAQMKWKPSCKQGSAKWGYDGLCAPEVFKCLLAAHLKPKELAAPLKDVVTKRLTVEEFRTAFNAGWGDLSAPIRYGSLSVTGENVTLRYTCETGELRITGSYGL